jgi:hypothetical protein
VSELLHLRQQFQGKTARTFPYEIPLETSTLLGQSTAHLQRTKALTYTW